MPKSSVLPRTEETHLGRLGSGGRRQRKPEELAAKILTCKYTCTGNSYRSCDCVKGWSSGLRQAVALVFPLLLLDGVIPGVRASFCIYKRFERSSASTASAVELQHPTKFHHFICCSSGKLFQGFFHQAESFFKVSQAQVWSKMRVVLPSTVNNMI